MILTRQRLEALLAGFPRLRIAVIGDFFLDRYLVTDPALSEPSLETGLEARQVVARRASPGHAGTVTNNLHALGVARLQAIGFTGDDGEGFELRRCLEARGVDISRLVTWADVVTGTYLKPAALQPDGTERELERLDLKNRRPLPQGLEARLIDHLRRLVEPAAGGIDAVIVADQVEERNHGAITDRVRDALCELARERPDLIWLADSRRRIGDYRHVRLKPNRDECRRATGGADAIAGARALARRAGRTIFLTLSEEGIVVVEPDGAAQHVPALPVTGPIDPTGAGDAATAGIVCALATGASPVEAASVGALVAGVTVQQLGTTGTATPSQVLDAFERAASGGPIASQAR